MKFIIEFPEDLVTPKGLHLPKRENVEQVRKHG